MRKKTIKKGEYGGLKIQFLRTVHLNVQCMFNDFQADDKIFMREKTKKKLEDGNLQTLRMKII